MLNNFQKHEVTLGNLFMFLDLIEQDEARSLHDIEQQQQPHYSLHVLSDKRGKLLGRI